MDTSTVKENMLSPLIVLLEGSSFAHFLVSDNCAMRWRLLAQAGSSIPRFSGVRLLSTCKS